jgi:hypothetical protein
MNTLPGSTRPTARADHIDAALLRAVADMRPGWIVLRDCLLADDGRGTRARVRYALLHPKIGIALLDVLPGATTPGAPDRMRRLLDASNFRRAFGDFPPIVYLCVRSRALSEIAPLLAREFGVLPPLAPTGGDAWVAAARWALAAAEQSLRVSEQMDNYGRSEPMGPPRPERVEGWSAPRHALGLRALGVFWGAVALAFGGVVVALENLGPPEAPAAVANAGVSSDGVRAASEGAWLRPALPDTATPSIPGPMLALWPAERMRTRFDTARAGGVATLESDDAATVGVRPDGDRSAPIGIIAEVRPPWPQVAAVHTEAPSAPVRQVEHNGGSGDVLPIKATRPPPPQSETGSDAPEMVSGSEGAPAGGGSPPATVGTAADPGTAQAPGATVDDETPASDSESGADAAAAGARDAGPVAPPLPDLGEATAPAQASVPSAPPTGASEVPAAADVRDSRDADPQSARGPDGLGAVVRPPPATEPMPAPDTSAPIEMVRAPGASPTQQVIRAFVALTADAHATDPAAASAAQTASSSATATADGLPATGPPAVPLTHAEPLPARVQPAATAVPSAAAPASVAASATRPEPPPPSGASPAAVAALLARGDALFAIGNVSAARLVYQRAAALASARAATATGKTFDPRSLQAIGAIGVVADPDAAAAWYRRGSALGDEDAAPLLGGLDVKASQ